MQDMFMSLQQFEESYVRFSAFEESFRHIANAIQIFRQAGIVQNLRILGESGTGKTTLCKLIKKEYPRQVLVEQDIVPVLIVPIPSNPSILSLIESIFNELEYPIEIKGNIPAKMRTLIKICKEVKLEMIVFDEAQHLRDRGQSKTHHMVADWLKTLMDALKIPFVMLGLPNLEKLLQSNEQLRRRYSQKIYLALGQTAHISVESECGQLFQSLAEDLPIPFRLNEMAWNDFSVRLYYACDGRIAYLKKLMFGSLKIALEEKSSEITIHEFKLAFRRLIWWEADGALNPFAAEFEYRRLDRAGEPFEKDMS